jgi:hypothetical protein
VFTKSFNFTDVALNRFTYSFASGTPKLFPKTAQGPASINYEMDVKNKDATVNIGTGKAYVMGFIHEIRRVSDPLELCVTPALLHADKIGAEDEIYEWHLARVGRRGYKQ